MKQRIISAIIGLVLFFIVLYFYNTLLFNIALALVCMISAYEILKTVNLISEKALSAICIIFAGTVPFLRMPGMPDLRSIAILIFLLLVFTILLSSHKRVQISSLAVCCSITIAISFSLSNLIYIRDDFNITSLYYILLVFALAWICDGGAYFVGSKFGKHKMSPNISPNKTVEGAVGGIITNIIIAIVLTLIYCGITGIDFLSIAFVSLLILSLLCSLIGMLGDLSASIIKRQYDIKDFGNLIPGHGGAVDRFDSVIFVAPFLYVFISYFPILL